MWIETIADSAQQQAEKLAQAVAEELRAAIKHRGRACIAVSGGKSPIEFFDCLSQESLDWSKVLVTLVDERWVAADSGESNEKLVREHLLKNNSEVAYFLPLKNSAETPAEGIMDCETQLREQIDQLDVVVLGMGLDGHTASWFSATSSIDELASINTSAWCLPVEDEALDFARMSLTWGLMHQAKQIFLSFSGEDKYQVFLMANEISDRNELPISHVLQGSEKTIQVYCSK